MAAIVLALHRCGYRWPVLAERMWWIWKWRWGRRAKSTTNANHIDSYGYCNIRCPLSHGNVDFDGELIRNTNAAGRSFDVVKFVAAKASKTRKDQQASRRGLQVIPSKAVKIDEFQQVPIKSVTWFGTRGSEVQILSPRPIKSTAYG